MMKNTKLGAYIYNDESCNFNFYTSLSAHDKTVFVRTVVETLVDDTNYDSVLREIIFDYVIISMFTDIDTSFLKTVDNGGNVITNIDLLEQFLEETNVVDVVKSNAEIGLLEELNKATDKSIEYRTGIHPSPIADSIASLLSTIERKVDEFDMSDMMNMVQKFAGMTGELTPENLINAYMDSDMHRKNLAEIEEVKKNRTEIAESLDKAIKKVNAEAEAKKNIKSKK